MIAARTMPQVMAEILQLLPSGWAFHRDPGSNYAMQMAGLAQVVADFEASGLSLLPESDPRSTVALLTDYETVLGPDAGAPDPSTLTLAQRQASVWQRWTAQGGASRAFFQRIAQQLGYTATIVEFQPFYVGINAPGDLLLTDIWATVWEVQTVEPAGANSALLEAAVQRFRPSQTDVFFTYGVAA